jgi:hypothetical protein
MSFADGSGEKSEGKRAVRSRFFGSNRANKAVSEAKKRIFPVIFRGQNSPCGRIRGKSFSNGIDSKRVINNLQCFEGNLYPHGV